jgi:hypothetical protein
MKKKLSKEEINKLISDTRKELAEFERSIKKAPKEKRGEFKVFVQKSKTKLKSLEKLLSSGKWMIEK